MASFVYNSAKVAMIDGTIDLDTDTINVLLVTSPYTPNKDTHDFRDDVTNEVVGTGYTTGGKALVNKTVTQDNTNDRAKFDADDLAWTSATITARAAVLYKARGGSSSADELIAYIDFLADKASTAATFTIQWHADGIFYLGE
ncbi:hypothetical protein LCGC14_1614280 [marine sediment metagenome]|uniref:Uncharacterized protein n=1 Tax=marine sediment metagenome TaxID=412755 RepID=A0A0F9L7L0_9ZZZZ